MTSRSGGERLCKDLLLTVSLADCTVYPVPQVTSGVTMYPCISACDGDTVIVGFSLCILIRTLQRDTGLQ